MVLSKLQQEIVEATDKKTIVISSAASGKTRVLTEKVRHLLRQDVSPTQIAVITFTNMAAAELKQRLGEDYRDGIFIGTIHALANLFLLSYGIDTHTLLKDDKFDDLFREVELHPQCIHHYQWILLDEGQDSDQLQFTFLFKLINPECFFICADPKQSIYMWKGSKPELIQELSTHKDVKVYSLNENYRNGANILKWAKWVLMSTGLYDNSISMRSTPGQVLEGEYTAETLKNILRGQSSYNNWAVLCRTNLEIDKVFSILKGIGLPCETFRQGDLSKEELTQKMADNTVKILTVHSAKGLEWDNVITVGMRQYNKEECNVCYVAATRARNLLYWLHYPKKKVIKRF